MPRYGNKGTFVTAKNAEEARKRFKKLGWRIPKDFHRLAKEE